MDLSADEVAVFRELFSTTSTELVGESNKALDAQTEIPSSLDSILNQSNLSTLAEGQGYELWIPLKIEKDEFGGLKPNLGIPEVIDNNGYQRSWRVKLLEDDTLTLKYDLKNSKKQSSI